MENQCVTIRPFDASTDLEILSDIWLETSLQAHPFIGAPRILEQRRLIKEKYLPEAETWVACQAGVPIGFISLLDSFLGGLFIATNHQGQGVGRKLIEHALDRKNELSLEVYTQNKRAVAFYKALGFRELSRRDVDDSGDPFENASLHLKG